MRFFLLSLCINIILLLLPLSSHELSQKPKQNISIALNMQENQINQLMQQRSKKEDKQPKKIVKKKIVKHKVKKPTKVAEKKSLHKKVSRAKKVSKSRKNLKSAKKLSSVKSKKSNNSQKGDNEFCQEGVDFKILKKADQTYPRQAIRMRMRRSVSIDVYFKIDHKNHIIIIKTIGEDGIFKNEAIKRVGNMRVSLIKKNATNCKIIKPFRFEP